MWSIPLDGRLLDFDALDFEQDVVGDPVARRIAAATSRSSRIPSMQVAKFVSGFGPTQGVGPLGQVSQRTTAPTNSLSSRRFVSDNRRRRRLRGRGTPRAQRPAAGGRRQAASRSIQPESTTTTTTSTRTVWLGLGTKRAALLLGGESGQAQRALPDLTGSGGPR